MNSKSIAVAALVASIVPIANADTLWDQSAIDLNSLISMANYTRTSGFGQREAYGMTDVTVPAGGWTIQSISVYTGTLAFSPITGATINVFPKVGSLPLPSDNPRLPANGGTGTAVSVTVTPFEINGNSGQFANQVTASGLNIVLAPGSYWIGLAPKYQGNSTDNQWPALNFFGDSQPVRFAAPLDATWSDNAALLGAPPTDGAILIEGVVPAPSSLTLLGAGAIFARRRR